MTYNLGLESLVVVATLCLQLVYAQQQTTAAPSTGLMTVDYIIIGVTSAAGAFCIGLIIYVVISSKKESKNKSKVAQMKVEDDKKSIVSKKSSKSSMSSKSGKSNQAAKLNDD